MTRVYKIFSAERPKEAPVASIRKKRIATYLAAQLEREAKSS